MEDGLAGIGAAIGQQAPAAGGDALFLGQPGRNLGHPPGGDGDFGSHVRQSRAVGLRDDQQVDRRLGKDVLEGEQAVIFVH